MVIRATALLMVASTSFASRRQRPGRAKVRSTTRRRATTRPLGRIGALDDFDGPLAGLVERATQFPSAITALGKDVARPRIGYRRRGEQTRRPGAVPNVGLMHHDRDRQATRIGDDMALAALDLLARVIAASVGFTDRLSMTPAVGSPLRPTGSRAAPTSALSTGSSRPLSCIR